MIEHGRETWVEMVLAQYIDDIGKEVPLLLVIQEVAKRVGLTEWVSGQNGLIGLTRNTSSKIFICSNNS